MKSRIFLLALLLISFAMGQAADIPKTINYQGLLTDQTTGDPITGTADLLFKIYNCESCTGPEDILWIESHVSVPLENGLFNVILGSDNPIPDTVFNKASRWLGITINTDPEISPRTKLTSVAYSYRALGADTAEYAEDIADFSVTQSKIINGAVNTGHIQPDAVTGQHIMDGEIKDADIFAGADIQPGKIAGTAMDLSTTQTVTGDKYFDGTVYFGDSTMIINNDGILWGSDVAPMADYFLRFTRDYNATSGRWGIHCRMDNESTGSMYPIFGKAVNAGGGERFGGVFYGEGVDGSVTTGNSAGAFCQALYGVQAYGVYGAAAGALANFGIYATCFESSGDYGGYFYGNLHSTGTNTKGSGGYTIDHPDDPENMLLIHSDVSSPDMMNIYNGNVTTDANGDAVVELPDYFESLNADFRYQLTVVGTFAQAIISEKISGNRFSIKTDRPFVEVSWQVTGIRQDVFAKDVRFEVESAKENDKQGLYMHPELYGYGVEKSLNKDNHKGAQVEELTNE